jgi:hypothetical protein
VTAQRSQINRSLGIGYDVSAIQPRPTFTSVLGDSIRARTYAQ